MNGQSDLNRQIFQNNLAAAGANAQRLRWSLNHVANWFPLDAERVVALTDEKQESLDALLHRFNNLFSMIQDQLFRGIALLEQEDIRSMSNRDKTALMEKLGALDSAAEFSHLAELRNKLAHHYPDDPERQVERLNLAFEKAPALLTVFDGLREYVAIKKLGDFR